MNQPRKLREVPMQEKLIPRTPEEKQKMKIELGELTAQYIMLDFQKRMDMRDYTERLSEIWTKMEVLEAAIKE